MELDKAAKDRFGTVWVRPVRLEKKIHIEEWEERMVDGENLWRALNPKLRS